MDPLLQSIQDSAFSHWAQFSLYPILITLHAIGLAILVGFLAVINLRVLGFAKQLALPALRGLMKVVWIGFWINAASGAALFCIDAKKDYYSELFRIKLSVIAVGMLLAKVIEAKLLRVPSFGAKAAEEPRVRAKLLALAALLCWIGAIVSGRLLAFATFGDLGVE